MASKWLNPPFDPRILSVGATTSRTHLKKGYLICRDPSDSSLNWVKGKGVLFLYNPLEVTVDHTVQQTATGGPAQPTTASLSSLPMMGVGTVSVDLLYDRTYELWDSSKKNTLAGRYGVYADVLGFYKMTGIVKQQTVNKNVGLYGTATDYSGFDQFPTGALNGSSMYHLYMGDKLRWQGTMADLSITYSHWTRNMIPSRCSITVSMYLQTDTKGGKKVITKGGKVAPGSKPPPAVTPPRRPTGKGPHSGGGVTIPGGGSTAPGVIPDDGWVSGGGF